MIFMSGDKAGADEAQALIPGCQVAVVKTGLSPQKKGLAVASAISLSPEKAREEIKSGIKKALSELGKTKPYFIPGPYKLKVEFTDPKYAKGGANRPGVKQFDEVTLLMENAPEPWLMI